MALGHLAGMGAAEERGDHACGSPREYLSGG
jgi:hypothetical protein